VIEQANKGSSPQLDETAPEICARLLKSARDVSASDIHIQPLPDGSADVAYRLDGVIRPIESLNSSVAELVIGRIKFLAKLKTYEHSLPQDGRIGGSDTGIDQELRVSTFPTVSGEKVVIRFFTEQQTGPLDQLGLDLDTLKTLQTFLNQTQGLLLLTGPSGSGKTTTIYSCLHYLRTADRRHIITIEDPVEQLIPGIMQTEVNEARGLTFPKSIRHLLRQDPEVIVIGEIRDDETAEIAVRAALTGHQVIATLHAGSCHGVIDRLRVMVEDRYALASVLELIVNQRLVRRLCEPCSGKGCSRCLNSGYDGRVPLVETLRLDSKDREKLQQSLPLTSSPQPTLRQAASKLISLGVTNDREIKRILGT
jgi:type II secretory ATPase GspE/PulE/Tfp pilus assembly ATPase PilB-like protein